MKKDLSKNYREVNIILNLLGDLYKNKIPNKMKELFNKGEDKNYSPQITMDDFYEGNYLDDTKIILSILYINYWCAIEEKNNYMENIRKLDDKYKEEHKLVLNELFPKKDKIEDIRPVEIENNITNNEKTGIIGKIIEKIKSLIKK